MSVPSRWATCQMVSPGLAATTLPSRVKSNWSVIASFPLGAPGYFGSQSFIQEELHGRDESIGSGLSQPADRRIAHGLGQLGEQLLVPLPSFEQGHGLVASHPAGRALTA